jgi:hypothetical protein
MSVTDRISIRYFKESSVVAEASFPYTTGSRHEVSELCPGDSGSPVVTQLTFTLDVSAAKSILLLSTKDVTLKTNSSGSPAATVSLTANVPKIWSADVGGRIRSARRTSPASSW